MRVMIFVFRFLALTTLSFWLGGFTFYSAMVIPILHDAMGSLESGYVTQQVTQRLNMLGVAALVMGWLLQFVERRFQNSGVRRIRVGLLTSTTLLLVVLFALHRTMDLRLAAKGLRNFYPLHRAYLIVSTIQWFINLGLLAEQAWGYGRSLPWMKMKSAEEPKAV